MSARVRRWKQVWFCASYVRLTFVGLQQRLLSSIAAFAKTLEVHRKGLLRADVAERREQKHSSMAGLR